MSLYYLEHISTLRTFEYLLSRPGAAIWGMTWLTYRTNLEDRAVMWDTIHLTRKTPLTSFSTSITGPSESASVNLRQAERIFRASYSGPGLFGNRRPSAAEISSPTVLSSTLAAQCSRSTLAWLTNSHQIPAILLQSYKGDEQRVLHTYLSWVVRRCSSER